jgi:hydroxyacylglutathione hydrolase
VTDASPGKANDVSALDVTMMTVGPLQENCYLVVDRTTGEGVLVDPGDEADTILAVLNEKQARLTAIWLTHAHVDHVGAVAPIVAALPVPVYLHPADLPLYTRAAATGRLYGMDFEQPEPPDRELAEGDVLHCGTVRFEVYHLPGHAPGHVAFVGNGLCLSGDVLFAGSMGRTDLPLSDPTAMHQSLQRMAAMPGELVVLPGHGETTTLEREQATNPFLRGIARPVGS